MLFLSSYQIKLQWIHKRQNLNIFNLFTTKYILGKLSQNKIKVPINMLGHQNRLTARSSTVWPFDDTTLHYHFTDGFLLVTSVLCSLFTPFLPAFWIKCFENPINLSYQLSLLSLLALFLNSWPRVMVASFTCHHLIFK